jgi:hypothetical protein
MKLSVEDIISNSGLKRIDNYITRINNGTESNKIKNVVVLEGASKVTITNQAGEEIKDTDIIATGYKVEISSGEDTKMYILSVLGDTSGDGDVTILDLLQIQKHLTNSKKLTSECLLAADTSGDGDVTILDLLQVQKHIKGAKKL